MYNLTGGGAEKVLVDVLQNFDYSRYDVELALVVEEGVYLHDVPSNVKIIKLYDKLLFYFSFGLVRFLNLHFVNRFLIKRKIKNQYDAIISFMEGYPVVVHSYLTDQAKMNISWVHTNLFTFHHTTFLSAYGDKLEEKCYRMMDKLVFVSQDSAEQFDKLFKIEAPHIVIYNPIPKESIIALSDTECVAKQKFVIGSVARLVEPKRLDRMMRVARRLKDAKYDVEFWIVGDGKLKKDLLIMQKQLGLEEYVKFWGFKKPAYPYVKQFDVFLLTSSTEGYPLAVCEAMCLGIPICATRTTGTFEILDNGRYGVLTEQNEDSIFNELKGIIDNGDYRNQLHEKSMERSEMFDVRTTMEEIYRIL